MEDTTNSVTPRPTRSLPPLPSKTNETETEKELRRPEKAPPPVPTRSKSQTHLRDAVTKKTPPPVPPKPTIHRSHNFYTTPPEVKILLHQSLPSSSKAMETPFAGPDAAVSVDEQTPELTSSEASVPDSAGASGEDAKEATDVSPPPQDEQPPKKPLPPLPPLPINKTNLSSSSNAPGSDASDTKNLNVSSPPSSRPPSTPPMPPPELLSGSNSARSSTEPLENGILSFSNRSSGEASSVYAGSEGSLSPLASPRASGNEEDDQHRVRTNIAREMLKTEQTYVKGLEIMTKYFLMPLREYAMRGNSDFITLEQLKYLFSNVEVIYNINNQFLRDLEHTLKDWNPTTKIGAVFLSICPFLKVYNEYVNNYNNCITTYESCMKNKKFKKFIDDAMAHPGLIPTVDNLPSYLIMPVQRIPRYVLLLTEMVRKTPKDHPDYKDLEAALSKIQEVAETMNASKRDAENIHKIHEIQKELIMPEDSKFKYKVIVTTNRRFVREGKFDVRENGEKSAYNYIFLFNDAVIFTKQKKKGYLYHLFLYLKRITVNPGTVEDKPAVTIIGNTKPITVTILFDTEEERNTWHKDLLNRSTPDLRPEDQMSDQDDFLASGSGNKEKEKDKEKHKQKIAADDDDSHLDGDAQSSKKERPTGGRKSRFKTLSSISKTKKLLAAQETSPRPQDDTVIRVNKSLTDELTKKLAARSMGSISPPVQHKK